MRTAVLFSGRGSNMAALLDAAAAPGFPAPIVVALSNRPDAPGLALARARDVEAVCIDHRAFGKDRAAHEAAVDAALRDRGVQLVCLAGYMRLFTPFLIGAWAGRMLNIHPSLLPMFRGLRPQHQALQAGVRISGCTVHVVTDEMDAGPILAQAAVPVLDGDTEDTLAARILVQEHRLYPLALRAFATGRAEPASGDAALLNAGLATAGLAKRGNTS